MNDTTLTTKKQRDLLIIALNEALIQLHTIMPWWSPNDIIQKAINSIPEKELDELLGDI